MRKKLTKVYVYRCLGLMNIGEIDLISLILFTFKKKIDLQHETDNLKINQK